MNEKVFCTACGAENNKGGKFCVNCGNPLETPATPATEAVQEPVAETDVHAGVQETAAETDMPANDAFVTNAETASATEGSPAAGATATYSQNTYSPSAVTYYAEPEAEKQGGYKGVAIASLICGIVSLVCCPAVCCGACLRGLDILIAIAAVVLGIIALVKAFEGKGIAIAGIICGGIAIVGMIITLLSSAALGTALYNIGDAFGEEFMEEFEDVFEDAMQDSGYYY